MSDDVICWEKGIHKLDKPCLGYLVFAANILLPGFGTMLVGCLTQKFGDKFCRENLMIGLI